jgi:hypothetical protein
MIFSTSAVVRVLLSVKRKENSMEKDSGGIILIPLVRMCRIVAWNSPTANER